MLLPHRGSQVPLRERPYREALDTRRRAGRLQDRAVLASVRQATERESGLGKPETANDSVPFGVFGGFEGKATSHARAGESNNGADDRDDDSRPHYRIGSGYVINEDKEAVF